MCTYPHNHRYVNGLNEDDLGELEIQIQHRQLISAPQFNPQDKVLDQEVLVGGFKSAYLMSKNYFQNSLLIYS